MGKTSLGIAIALLSFAVVFYTVEQGRSILQVAIGFILFTFLFGLISLLKSVPLVSIFVFLTATIVYLIFKLRYYDTFLGGLPALAIVGSILYFRVRPYKPFSPSGYKNETLKDREVK
jgi:magnesium-transporting ATPase (P-type)